MKIPKKFVIGFAVALSIFIVGFWFLKVDVNLNMGIFIIIWCAITGGLFHIKHKFHQGNFPIIAGAIFILGGSIAFFGTMSFDYPMEDGTVYHKEKWWTLTLPQMGVFILVAVFGVLIAKEGGKQAMKNQYFWGRKL